MADVTGRDARTRLAVLLIALAPRLIGGYFTFGSVDTIANFRNTLRILDGLPIAAPYFSALELWLWIASVIAVYTPLPVIFPFKLLPIACDALIALLLFDSAPDRRSGWRRAVLYGIAPVPIVISAMHTQWDSIWMYFLMLALVLVRIERPAMDAVAGAAFVLSVIFKPIAGPLILVILPRTKQRFLGFAGGVAAMLTIYYSILGALGWLPSWDEFIGILHYAQGGVRIFGLPYRPFDRFWAAMAMVVLLTVLHFARRLTRDEVALLFLAFAIGVSGLSIQYLIWVVPFALLCDRTRFLALYTVAAGVFVVFFYQFPRVNILNTENLGTFAMLEPFGAFAPPLPSAALRPSVLFLGNYVVPLLCLGVVVHGIWAAARGGRTEAGLRPTPGRVVGPFVVFLALIGVATIVAALMPPLDPARYIVRVEEKIGAYDVLRYLGPTMMRAGSKIWVARSLFEEGVANPILNISNVLLAWTAAAAALTALWRTRSVQP